MARQKKYTHIGNVNGDPYQHIVRLPCGRLTIVRHGREVRDYIFFIDGNFKVAINTDTGETQISCASLTLMANVQSHIELARAVRAHIFSQGE